MMTSKVFLILCAFAIVVDSQAAQDCSGLPQGFKFPAEATFAKTHHLEIHQGGYGRFRIAPDVGGAPIDMTSQNENQSAEKQGNKPLVNNGKLCYGDAGQCSGKQSQQTLTDADGKIVGYVILNEATATIFSVDAYKRLDKNKPYVKISLKAKKPEAGVLSILTVEAFTFQNAEEGGTKKMEPIRTGELVRDITDLKLRSGIAYTDELLPLDGFAYSAPSKVNPNNAIIFGTDPCASSKLMQTSYYKKPTESEILIKPSFDKIVEVLGRLPESATHGPESGSK